jgi:CubicO group peptidase (beta-lactamase class C family)
MTSVLKIRVARLSLIAALCAVVSFPVLSAPGSAPAAATGKLEQLMREANVSGAALAQVKGGRLAWVAVRGERAPGQPVTEETVFNAASLTKPLFATVVLHQVAQDRVDLDASLAPDWVDPDVAKDPRRLQLTARLVLSHQSGFLNWRGREPLRFTFAPGERHEYSGEGYEYLRRALEKRTQRSLTELAQETVFARVGMSATYLGWNDRLEGRVALGFDERGLPHARQDLSNTRPNAAANLFTTIGDYGRFAAWVARGADLPPTLWREMQKPQARHANPAEQFGLGWHVIDVDGEAVLWHEGRESGMRNLVVVLPSSGDALVLLTNSDNGELLMRALITDRLPEGEALNAALDRQVWTYLQNMPRAQVAAVARTIAGSPGFLSKLLHAVHTTQIATAVLPAAERRAALSAIDAYVQALRQGGIAPDQAERLVARLLDTRGTEQVWKKALSAPQREAWIAALAERSVGRADRVPLVVAPELLARYVGQFRVPSSNLLITIERHEQSLRASAPGMPPITLLGTTNTQFFMREDDTRFEFVAEADGTVRQLKLLWRGGRSELAHREL